MPVVCCFLSLGHQSLIHSLALIQEGAIIARGKPTVGEQRHTDIYPQHGLLPLLLRLEKTLIERRLLRHPPLLIGLLLLHPLEILGLQHTRLSSALLRSRRALYAKRLSCS
jgi:hypothetical protein